MQLPITAGDIIRAARRKKQMGQAKFGPEVLGVQQTLLSRYETGAIENPPAAVIIHCANILLEDDVASNEVEQLFQKLKNLTSMDQGNVRLTIPQIMEALEQYMQSLKAS
jgi:transcriptional regulator with XRE-family HTH domain